MDNFRTFDLLDNLIGKFPKDDALASKINGQWIKISSQEYIDTVQLVSAGLLNAGIQKGDKIATITNNRFEWNFMDMGMAQIGVIHVPIYPTISENDLKFILHDAEVKMIFVSSDELYNKAKKAMADMSDIPVYTFNKYEQLPHWTIIKDSGKQNPKKAEIKALKDAIVDTELFTILYTSGTTGNPKGVMLNHRNIISNCMACRGLAPFAPHWRALSFLPVNHVYERMLMYLYQFFGISIYYAESLETIGDNLKEVKPHVFVTVPRLLEKVYDKIVAKGHEQTGIKKSLFFWALDLGLKYELNGANGWWYEFQLSIANKLIFSKWREALGGNVVAVASGGAALQARLARVFNAAQITVLEGYGLTETSPVIAVNTFNPGGQWFGTVGPVIEGVTVKLAEDGEICVKGPNVMMGYYKRPDLTDEIMDAEGFLHTGDIGVFEHGKYLKITDRKKEIFKTSGGKYIAPQPIENKLKESPFIEQAMVIGENQKFPAAFIVPSFAYLKEYCAQHGIDFGSNENIIKNQQIIAKIQSEMDKVNQHLAQYEQIKKFELLAREWNIESGEMTPKLSLRRKQIMLANQAAFDRIYSA